jgi:hypothetical protein
MSNSIVRIVGCFFVCAFAYLLVSFSLGVGEGGIVKYVIFFILGVLSQLGLFLSTYQIKKGVLNFLIALMMLPFFMFLLSSTILDSSFISRLTGNLIQVASSMAYVGGIVVYIFSYYRLAKLQYNKNLKRDG